MKALMQITKAHHNCYTPPALNRATMSQRADEIKQRTVESGKRAALGQIETGEKQSVENRVNRFRRFAIVYK